MLEKALKGLIEEGKPYNVEFKIRRPPDGKIIDIHSIAEYSSEKGVVFGVIQDITERKRTEEALRDSELRLRTILQTVNEGFWLIDNDTVTMDLNPRMCAILGRNRDEVFGRKIFDFVDSENKAIFEQQIRLRAQEEVGTYEIASLVLMGQMSSACSIQHRFLTDQGIRSARLQW